MTAVVITGTLAQWILLKYIVAFSSISSVPKRKKNGPVLFEYLRSIRDQLSRKMLPFGVKICQTVIRYQWLKIILYLTLVWILHQRCCASKPRQAFSQLPPWITWSRQWCMDWLHSLEYMIYDCIQNVGRGRISSTHRPSIKLGNSGHIF